MTHLLAALTGLTAAVAAAWFVGMAVVVFCIHYPGIPLLAATAIVVARQSIHPHPLVTRIRSLT